MSYPNAQGQPPNPQPYSQQGGQAYPQPYPQQGGQAYPQPYPQQGGQAYPQPYPQQGGQAYPQPYPQQGGQAYPQQGEGVPMPAQAPPAATKPLGAGGLPCALPYFRGAEGEIRHGFECCCLDYKAGPNVPPHWYDGGRGWVTRYFTDVVAFDPATRENGRFRCQVPTGPGGHCNHEIQGEGCCDGNCCWCPTEGAVGKMVDHATTQHGARPPPPRQWQTGLCDTEGCFDTLCCVPCQGSRQMMALAGHADTFNVWWCLFFTLLGFRYEGDRRAYWVPPWIFVALFTRPRMATLSNVDEGCCIMCLTVLCCSPCSVAQTYRELKLGGVWTGSTCCNDPPTSSTGPPETKMA